MAKPSRKETSLARHSDSDDGRNSEGWCFSKARVLFLLESKQFLEDQMMFKSMFYRPLPAPNMGILVPGSMLDREKQTISFSKNGRDLGVAYKCLGCDWVRWPWINLVRNVGPVSRNGWEKRSGTACCLKEGKDKQVRFLFQSHMIHALVCIL
jgi:hypothetical protein